MSACGRLGCRSATQGVLSEFEAFVARQTTTLIEQIKELILTAQVAAGLQIQNFDAWAAGLRENLQEHGGNGGRDFAVAERGVEQVGVETLSKTKSSAGVEELKETIDLI
jgi:hypothetical protein